MSRERLAEGLRVRPVPDTESRPGANRAANFDTAFSGDENASITTSALQIKRLVERFALPPAIAAAVAIAHWGLRP